MKTRVYIRTGPGDTRTVVVDEGARVELAPGEVIEKAIVIEDPHAVREAIVAEQVRADVPTTATSSRTLVLTDFGLVEPLMADALAKLTPDEAAAVWRWGRGDLPR